MSTQKMPLSVEEKRILKRVFSIRIFLGLFFLVPFLLCLGLIVYKSIGDFLAKRFDFLTIAGIAIAITAVYLIIRFVVPFYRRSFENSRASHKLIIETSINSIQRNYANRGVRYVVDTNDFCIDSWQVAILTNKLPFSELRENMKIRIHQIEANKTDILCIEKC